MEREMTRSAELVDLPPDVLRIILSHLDVRSLASLSMVSRALREEASRCDIWERLCHHIINNHDAATAFISGIEKKSIRVKRAFARFLYPLRHCGNTLWNCERGAEPYGSMMATGFCTVDQSVSPWRIAMIASSITKSLVPSRTNNIANQLVGHRIGFVVPDKITLKPMAFCQRPGRVRAGREPESEGGFDGHRGHVHCVETENGLAKLEFECGEGCQQDQLEYVQRIREVLRTVVNNATAPDDNYIRALETYARVGLGNLRAINRLEQSLQAAAHPCAMSPNTIIYQSQRYNTHSETALDPCLWNFTGIYGGCYGPHGTEFLDIGFREIMDNPGEQQQLWLECIKITGDPNIPSGRVSIKAKAVLSAIDQRDVDDRGRLFVPDSYSADKQDAEEVMALGRPLGVFKGVGQLADRGYCNPSWSRVELVLFENKSIGVLWHSLHAFSLFRKLIDEKNASSVAALLIA